MWECPKCNKTNTDEEGMCSCCGLNYPRRYVKMPMEDLMDFANRKECYTLSTLQRVCDALMIRGEKEEAEKLKQYIEQQKLEQQSQGKPALQSGRLKKILYSAGGCGGTGILIELITNSLKKEEEYQIASKVIRLSGMFGSSGSELKEAQSYVQAVNGWGDFGIFLIIAAIVLLIIYFVMRAKASVSSFPQINNILPRITTPDSPVSTQAPITVQQERNFCTQCGCQAQDKALFCARCGHKLKD